jgi:MFS family permease
LDRPDRRVNLRKLLPDLPRQTWILLAGDSISFFGNGLALPFTIVYLVRVRGIPIEVAGLILSTRAGVSLVTSLIAGSIVDKVGARRVLIFSLLTSFVSALAFIRVTEAWEGFIAAAILGVGWGSFWPSMQSMLVRSVQPHQRSAVFAVHYAALNLGIGVGGIVGGLLADIASARTFEMLYLLDAMTFLPTVVLLLTVLRKMGGAQPAEEGAAAVGGYVDVLKDRLFLRIMGLTLMLTIVGYSQLESSFPAYATGPGGIGTAALGLAFAGNTFFIVVAQLVVLKRVEGARRTRAVSLMALSWAVCWSVTLAAGLIGGNAAYAGFFLAMVVFAFGETLLSPTIPAMVNDLAPEQLRGRYNATYALGWSGGSIIGPAIAGFFLGADLATVFFIGLVGACLAAAILAVRLERHLPAEANLVTGEVSEA